MCAKSARLRRVSGSHRPQEDPRALLLSKALAQA